jgi:hypothetical protein
MAARVILPIGTPLLGEALERGQTVVIKEAVHGAMLLPLIRTTTITTTREVVISGVPGVVVEETHGIQRAITTSGITTQEAINGEEVVIMEDGMDPEMTKILRVLGILAITMRILVVVLPGVTTPQTTNSKRTITAATGVTRTKGSRVRQEKITQPLP